MLLVKFNSKSKYIHGTRLCTYLFAFDRLPLVISIVTMREFSDYPTISPFVLERCNLA